MSKTAKVVIVFSSIALVCLIAVGVIIGITFNGKNNFNNFSDIFGNATVVNESEELSLENVDALFVECISGDIVFVESDEARVTLKGRIWATKPQDSYLTVTEEGDSVRVAFELEKLRPFNFHSAEIEMTIYLPKELMLDLNVENTSGNLEISNMQFGDVVVRNSSGNADFKDVIASNVDYRLTSGNTTFSNCAFEKLAVDCSSGSVRIYDTTADTLVDCTSGDVVLGRIDGALNVTATSGNVTIDAASAAMKPISVRITSGNIRLNVYEDSAFELEAKVTSGNIDMNIPIEISGKQDRNVINGTRNGGGVLVDLESTSGSITISTID